MGDGPLLSVRGLTVTVDDDPRSDHPPRTVVDSLSFDLGVERVALVGESGSGKSLTARALVGLLRPPLAMRADRMNFADRDLRYLTAAEWSRLRGAEIALVLQDPRHALNPVQRVATQLHEALSLHGHATRAARQRRIREMLDAVGLSVSVLELYPHQLSGGMGQRVVLAMMLINGPRVLIADEPTSALDAERRDQALGLLSDLVAARRMGLLMISHDLQSVARHCDRVLVMYRGRIVDAADATALPQSQHPYTRVLWSCRPSAATYGTVLPVLDRSAFAREEPA